MSPTLELACELLARPSLTPDDAQCQDLIAARLQPLGFVCETLASVTPQGLVSNLWAKRAGRAMQGVDRANELMVFAGHTDVVPTGPEQQWHSAPFVPTLREGRLYARGAADMKTSIAAFVVALEEFIAAQPETPLSLAVLLTSDEEGPATHGTVKVCEMLRERGERLDYCIVGEPTAHTRTGDTIKNGRRGSLSARLTVKGVQGHIAYPQLAKNPVHLLAPALAELVAMEWDQGNEFFPPSTWQVSNIHAGTGAGNVIPGSVVVDCNFRFGTASTALGLQQGLQAVLDRHGLDCDVAWTLGAKPFLTVSGTLVQAVRDAIQAQTGLHAELSTSGGTSDARFIAEICPQVIEFGPPNASIHQINEHIEVAQIEPLKDSYRRVLDNLHARLTCT